MIAQLSLVTSKSGGIIRGETGYSHKGISEAFWIVLRPPWVGVGEQEETCLNVGPKREGCLGSREKLDQDMALTSSRGHQDAMQVEKLETKCWTSYA